MSKSLTYGEGGASRYKAPLLPFCSARGDKIDYWNVPLKGGRGAGRALAVPYIKHLCETEAWDTTPLLSYVVSDMTKKIRAAKTPQEKTEIQEQLFGFFEAVCRATRDAITAAPDVRDRFSKLSKAAITRDLNEAFKTR